MGAKRRKLIIFGGGMMIIVVLLVPLIVNQYRIHARARATQELVIAINAGDLSGVRQALKQGADPNIPPSESACWPPIHVAVYSGGDAVVQALLDAGADPDLMDLMGNTPLVVSILDQNTGAARLLIEGGADVNLDTRAGRAICVAITGRQLELLEPLVQAGADLNADGEPLLHWAARYHWRLPASDNPGSRLLDLGADPCARGFAGITPLHAAAGYGNVALMQRLVEMGADPDAEDDQGQTPLHCAATSLQHNAIQYLLQQGVDVAREDTEGKTALHRAIAAGIQFDVASPKVVQMLREAMARQAGEAREQ